MRKSFYNIKHQCTSYMLKNSSSKKEKSSLIFAFFLNVGVNIIKKSEDIFNKKFETEKKLKNIISPTIMIIRVNENNYIAK